MGYRRIGFVRCEGLLCGLVCDRVSTALQMTPGVLLQCGFMGKGAVVHVTVPGWKGILSGLHVLPP